MLVILCALVVVGFVLTRAAAGANRAHRLRDAAAWYDAGEHHLVGGQTESAIKALRRATAINRDNRTYRLALAGALAAGGQDDAARQVLLGVRESTPEDPEVNVQLRDSKRARTIWPKRFGITRTQCTARGTSTRGSSPSGKN